MSIDFRYLRAFTLTAEHSSFSKAAATLKIAQSAVSRQIKLLEESIGEELIVRSSKKVLLTQKGKSLYLLTKEFQHQAQELFEQEGQKIIRIGLLHGILERWGTDVLTAYYLKYGNNLQVTIDAPQNLKKDMEDGKYDLIFSLENVQSELITSLKLFDEELVLISRDTLQLSDLPQKRWIVYNENDFLFQISKKNSAHILAVDSITTMVKLVKNGLGVAVVPDHVLSPADELHRMALSGVKKSRVYLSTLNYKTLPKHLDQFVQVVLTSLPR